MIQCRAGLNDLRREAVEQGMKLLSHSAAGKVCEGLTSLEEALSIAGSIEEA